MPKVGSEYHLVAGYHRLQALLLLGVNREKCVVIGLSAAKARLWEISENLHRAELTVAARSEHVAEWVKLTAAKAKGAQVGPPSGGAQPGEKGINKAAKELGISDEKGTGSSADR